MIFSWLELQERGVCNMLAVQRPTNNWSQNQGWIEEDGQSTDTQSPYQPYQPPGARGAANTGQRNRQNIEIYIYRGEREL